MLSKKRIAEIEELLNSLNITCSNYDRLDIALTHSSHTFENKLPALENNERLEFLGDAVLKLLASEYLVERFQEYSEGELTKIRAILISDNILAQIANKINLGKYLRIGFHEEKQGGRKRPSNMACAFEALLGAIYLENKWAELRLMLMELIEEEVTEIDESAARSNFKAMLQEFTQANGMDLPIYNVIKEEGPPHNKVFEIEVLIDERPFGVGVGKTKKEAHQNAAKMAIENLGLFNE